MRLRGQACLRGGGEARLPRSSCCVKFKLFSANLPDR